MTAGTERAWWREPMVWLVIGIPSASVFAGIAMISIAVGTSADSVAEPFTRTGKMQTTDLTRDRQALAARVSATLALSADRRELVMTVEGTTATALRLELSHPIEADFDLSLVLRQVGVNRYAGALERPLDSALWDLQLTDPANQWRIVGRLGANDSSVGMIPALARD